MLHQKYCITYTPRCKSLKWCNIHQDYKCMFGCKVLCFHEYVYRMRNFIDEKRTVLFLWIQLGTTVYPNKYSHGFVVLCFVVVMQSFIVNSHEVFIHIHQGCFAGTGAIVRLPQCQWSKPDGYGKISQCITTTKHSKVKTACIFLGIYCTIELWWLETGNP